MALQFLSKRMLTPLYTSCYLASRQISLTNPLAYIMPRTRLRIVDNSALGKEAYQAGKPVRCIHVYNKIRKGQTGDRILVAIRGLKKHAYIVGSKVHPPIGMPRYDTNNIVLVNEDNTPLGTRILVPVPSKLRSIEGDISKVLAIATKFI